MQDIKMPKIGEIVEGKVIKVEENTIYLDLQAMTEGKYTSIIIQNQRPHLFLVL